MIIKLAEVPLETKYGIFTESLFGAGDKEAISLRMGELSGHTAVPVRIHSQCITGHVFNGVDAIVRFKWHSQSLDCSSRSRPDHWLDHEGKGNGHLAKMLSGPFKHQGCPQELAYQKAGYPRDNRVVLLGSGGADTL